MLVSVQTSDNNKLEKHVLEVESSNNIYTNDATHRHRPDGTLLILATQVTNLAR